MNAPRRCSRHDESGGQRNRRTDDEGSDQAYDSVERVGEKIITSQERFERYSDFGGWRKNGRINGAYPRDRGPQSDHDRDKSDLDKQNQRFHGRLALIRERPSLGKGRLFFTKGNPLSTARPVATKERSAPHEVQTNGTEAFARFAGAGI